MYGRIHDMRVLTYGMKYVLCGEYVIVDMNDTCQMYVCMHVHLRHAVCCADPTPICMCYVSSYGMPYVECSYVLTYGMPYV
jgi:hypothetical protein